MSEMKIAIKSLPLMSNYGINGMIFDLLDCYKVHYYLVFQLFMGSSWLIVAYRWGCVKLVLDKDCNFSLLLNPLQVRPGWRGASTEPQSVQFQAETPRPGWGRGWGGGWRRGGGGGQPDREVSRWGSGVPVAHHSGSVWGGWGGGRDGDGSLSYELRTHSQVEIAFVNTQTINKDGRHEGFVSALLMIVGHPPVPPPLVNLNIGFYIPFTVAQNGL